MSGAPQPFLLHEHIARMVKFSSATFGPGPRSKGMVDHIRKELVEIEADPLDVKEWIDVVILGLDGAWRALAASQPGDAVNPEFLANVIVHQLVAKQEKNEGRVWPDWRLVGQDKAIEHDRSHDTLVVEVAQAPAVEPAPAQAPGPTPTPAPAPTAKSRKG